MIAPAPSLFSGSVRALAASVSLFACVAGCAPAPARAPAPPQPIVPRVSAPAPAPPPPAPKPALCGGFEQRALAPTALPLLGGALKFRGLAGFEAQEAHSDLVTSSANDHETRLVLRDGPRKLSVHAVQLFRNAPAGLLSELKRVAPAGASVEAYNPEGLSGALVVPAELQDQGNDAWLLLSAYTQTADGLLQKTDFLANKAALGGGSSDGCVSLARSLARALAPGGASVNLSAGVRKLGAHRVTVPAGTALVTDRGPDFTVYHLYPVLPLAAPGGDALIYIGGFPEPFNPSGTAVRAHAFGAMRVWREHVTEKGQGSSATRSWTRRTVVALSHGLSADLFLEASDETVLHMLSDMIETTR